MPLRRNTGAWKGSTYLLPPGSKAHDVERPGWRLPLHVAMSRAAPIDPQTELVL